jgi:hypothetical protein
MKREYTAEYTPEANIVRRALRAWLHGDPPGTKVGVWFDDALRALLELDEALWEQRSGSDDARPEGATP